jgi:hypothetical protein
MVPGRRRGKHGTPVNGPSDLPWLLVLRHGLLPASRGGKLKCLTQDLAVVLYLLPIPEAAQVVRLPILVVASRSRS